MEIKGFWRFGVFCFVGGTSALIHMTVFYIFFDLILKNFLKSGIMIFGASIYYVIAYIIAVGVSLTYNFTLNRNLTFSARNEPVKKQIPKHIIVYATSIFTGFIVSLIVLNLIRENTLNALIATACGILASIPISFLGSMLWTFRKKDSV
jgi:putative flippase GtrA